MPEKKMLIVDAETARKIDENRGDMNTSEFINFLIDSQFQITGQPSLYYPGGLHAGMGHQHGGAGAAPSTKAPTEQATPKEPAAPPAGAHRH